MSEWTVTVAERHLDIRMIDSLADNGIGQD